MRNAVSASVNWMYARHRVFVAPAGHVGAQHVRAFAELRPGTPLLDLLPSNLRGAVRIGLNLDVEQARGPRVLSQQASDASLDRPDLLRTLAAAGGDFGQSLLDPFFEPRVHRLLFLAPIATATKNVGLLAAVGTRAQLDLQALADRVPVLRRQLLLESFELALGRSHDVLPLPGFEEVEVVFRDHAAVQRPDALRPAVTRFHRLDVNGARIVQRSALE